MKTSDLALMLLAGGVVVVAAALFAKKLPGPAAAPAGNGGPYGTDPRVTEITNNALPGQPGWGWRYYTDGSAIGPDGTYYSHGSVVWQP